MDRRGFLMAFGALLPLGALLRPRPVDPHILAAFEKGQVGTEQSLFFQAYARNKRSLVLDFDPGSKDREVLVAGLKAVRHIMAQPAIQPFITEEYEPGPDCVSDAEILDYIRERGRTSFHPTSTCRMGIDETAVVDERLRVRGIQGLRVIDASIMPALISGNTNAPSIMIGEKGADLVLADAN